MSSPSIAIYSANFGNYRDELKNGIDMAHFDKNIDYFFFTDNTKIKSNKWKVILTGCQPALPFIDRYRHTAKHIKFIVPKILHKYDIIIWVDTKCLTKLKFSKTKIIQLIQKQNNKSMFFIKHPIRKTSQQELIETIKRNVESKENGTKFLNKIKNIKFNTVLQDSCCIVYKANGDNIKMLKKIYKTLMKNGLKRDQNAIQYALFNNNYESNISYFTFQDLYK
jgi:hypothetical protein